MPKGIAFDEIATAARGYLTAAATEAGCGELLRLMQKVDAAVLRQYALPIELERALLELFTGWNRVGVPFVQDSYFPSELTHPMRYSDFVAYESDWRTTNRRRSDLIDEAIEETITDSEATELAALQEYADYYIAKVAPRPLLELERIEKRLLEKIASRKEGK